MLSPEKALLAARALAPIEAQEPVAAAWRYHEPSTVRTGVAVSAFLRGELRDWVLRRKPLRKPAPGQWVVFPLSDTPATIETLRPISLELARRGKAPFMLTGSRTISHVEGMRPSGQEALSRLRGQPSLPSRAALARRGWNLAGRISRFCSEPCTRWGTFLWLYEGLLIGAAARDWVSPAAGLVLESDITGFQKGLVTAARAALIPSIVIQHGFLGPHQFPSHAEHLFLWGRHFLEESETSYGLPPGRGIVTGCPRWDPLFQRRDEQHDPVLRAQMCRRPDQPVVLVISNAQGAAFYPAHYAPFFGTMRSLLDSDLNIAIRLHPSENGLENYSRNLPAEVLDRAIVLPAKIGLHEALLHADVAYQVFSAAVLEAMILKVPTLFESGGPIPRLTDYPDSGGGRWCSGPDTVPLCRELASPGGSRDDILFQQELFLDRMLANPGRATQFTVDALVGLEKSA